MAEYLLQLDEDCGVDSEWDVVAVRCEYFEAANALEAYAEMGGLKHGEQCSEEQARDILEWKTTVIEVGNTGRLIVAHY